MTALTLQACASTSPETSGLVTGSAPTPTLASPSATPPATPVAMTVAAAPSSAGGTMAPAAYTLTEEEKDLSCKKLTGRMQVRILQLRDYDSQAKPSAIAQTLQKTVSFFTPGDTGSALTDERYTRDRAQLEAYNQELASKGCKTFNLETELGAHAVGHTPAPQ